MENENINLEIFIEEIKANPLLYDKGNNIYMQIKLRDQIWGDISKKFNISGK